MKRIPGGREVERSLKETTKEIRSAIRQINEYAGKLLARCDYERAQGLIAKAREVEKFEVEVQSVVRKWNEIQEGAEEPNGPKEKAPPLWRYYVPILRTLIDLGGAARREAIENQMASHPPPFLTGQEAIGLEIQKNLKNAVKTALKAMEREGFVERNNKEWHITSSGRKAAEAKWKDGVIE